MENSSPATSLMNDIGYKLETWHEMYQYQKETLTKSPDLLSVDKFHGFQQNFLCEFLICSDEVNNNPK